MFDGNAGMGLARSRRRCGSGLCVATAVIVLLAGCGQRGQAPAETSPVGPVPASPQRPGDPARGYQALINQPYIHCGLPWNAYRKAAAPPSNDQLLPGREGRNAELPYQLTAYTARSGVDLVVNNCLTCHAGYFNGKLIVGLGNESLDFTEEPSRRAEAAGAYVETSAEAAEWRRWADVIRATSAYATTDTVGTNPALTLTLALIAHRDPKTLAWSDEPLLKLPPRRAVPASVPPWWRMGKKNALFSNTEARGDHARAMMLASLFCNEDRRAVEDVDAYAPDIRAYLASIRPPQWPYDVDRSLAATGRDVFERTCSACHGHYGEQSSYPNLVVALDVVGTDPDLALYPGDEDPLRFARWFNSSYYGELAYTAPAPGYIAPPLDGVWATAPYLHNGSVPTLEALLDSSRRPRYWTRSFRSDDYDPRTLGWRYQALQQGKAQTTDREQRKRIYDTTLPGYSNAGHRFGDALTDAERRAVLEYIKTL